MELNSLDKKFIKDWKTYDFSTWNEQTIREIFIAPFLRLLGYAKGTVNDILHEHTLSLTLPYHRIGRKQIDIDYIPTIRLKKFWIIEAKSGKDRNMDLGDFLQAPLYAIHPEIQAPFIVLINGWEIRIYDTQLSSGWDDYIIRSSQNDCENTFIDVKKFLSQRQIASSIRKHLLSTLKNSLEVELDESKVEELKKEFNRIYYDALPQIRKNAYDYKTEAWRKRFDDDSSKLKSKTFTELCVLMDLPSHAVPIVSNECFKRILSESQENRNNMVGKLVMIYRGRPHSVFRVHCVNIFCKLLIDNIDANLSGYINSVKEGLDELVGYNIKYWAFPVGEKRDHIGFALSHLDNICARFSYKLCNRFVLEVLKEIIADKRKALAIEDVLSESPSVPDEFISLVYQFHDFFYRLLSNGSQASQIWEGIWHLEFIEEFVLEKMKVGSYSSGDSDLLAYKNYGVSFDMLIFGTWSMVDMNWKHLDNHDLPQSIINLRKIKREDLPGLIPRPIPKPEGWIPTNESLMSLFGVFFPSNGKNQS